MNLFDTDVVDGGLQFGTAVAKVDRETLSATTAKKVTIGVRPEDVKVATSGNGLPVEVDIIEELGADGYLYGHTRVDGKRVDIVVRVDGRNHPNAGDKVFITPEPDHIHVFDTETGLRLSKKAVEAK
jgi:multiple sugar transport system ATP-binding protein